MAPAYLPTPSRQGSEGRGPGPYPQRVTGAPAVCGTNTLVLPSLPPNLLVSNSSIRLKNTGRRRPAAPNLRHSASVRFFRRSPVISERNSRLRSGSLTDAPHEQPIQRLWPQHLLIFVAVVLEVGILSRCWTSCALLHRWTLERTISMAHTLDYLGLDESHQRPPPAARSRNCAIRPGGHRRESV